MNPDKLYHSKWTAVKPEHSDKHFIVAEMLGDRRNNVVDVMLSRREFTMRWRELKNAGIWWMDWT